MSEAASGPKLFSPLTMRGLEVASRLWVAPMCQYEAHDGAPGDWHLVHYGSLALGRPGLIVAEATAVEPGGRISVRDTGLWADEHVTSWRRVVDFVHDQGVPMAVQLAHAGRKGSIFAPQDGRGSLSVSLGGWQTGGPSALPYGRMPAPDAMTVAQIHEVVDNFASAAERAVRIGFDAVEIHAAHGYLLHQFQSPTSNCREDGYGVEAGRPNRIVTDALEAVRSSIPSRVPLFVRISATEWLPGGWQLRDAVATAPALVSAGADLISVSSGGNDHRQDIKVGPAYQAPLAREVRRVITVPVGLAGLIDEAALAESLLTKLGRPM